MVDGFELSGLTGGEVADRWLRVLLAVVETGSFTRAGRALGIGQPAVSHVIKQLESALGAPVFARDRNQVVLTAPGRRLADGARMGFVDVDRAVRGFRLEGRDTDVELSVSMPLATYWLMPRLTEFRARHPEVELRVSTVDSDRLVGLDDADLWIPLGLGDWPELHRAVFCQERIYPVAAPQHPLARPDTTAAELQAAELIVHTERYDGRCDWDTWLHRTGHGVVADAAAPGGPRFSDYSLVIRAAMDGQGIALGWHHVVSDLVGGGRLARVGTAELLTENPLPVLARPASLTRPAVRALHDWLTCTAGGEGAGPHRPRTRPEQ